MENKINSNVIGQLVQTENFPDWWKSKLIPISFFDNLELTITFMDFEPEFDKEFIKEADNAISEFQKLGDSYKSEISKYIFEVCKKTLDEFDNNDFRDTFLGLKSENEIWKHIHPSEIMVTRRPYNDQDIYFICACECDWEREHGLQLVFRQGKKLTRVSEQDGHVTEADAFDKPDKEDKLLSKF
jgi:Domain of unknown function (DUF6985)